MANRWRLARLWIAPNRSARLFHKGSPPTSSSSPAACRRAISISCPTRFKPGKPVWFGVFSRPRGGGRCLVFGLPGNPASSLVCFELLVRPALAQLLGRPAERWHLPRLRARLAAAAKGAEDRPVYAPCRLERDSDGSLIAHPLPWTGSSDLVGLAVADVLLALPAGVRRAEPGDDVEVVLLGDDREPG